MTESEMAAKLAAAEARCAELEKSLYDAQAEASTVRRHYLHEKALKDAALAALDRLAQALREILYSCATGYYGPDGHDYATEAKRIARAALAGEEEE